MLGIFLIIFLVIILFLLLNKNYEKFIAKPSLVLNHFQKQARKKESVSSDSYERKALNLGLLHKVKNCYDTRRKDYYDCVKRLPIKIEKQPPVIKEKKYVNYGRYNNIQDLYPQSFK